MKKKIIISTLFLACLIISSCQTNNRQSSESDDVERPNSQGSVIDYDVEYYNNNDFNNYVLNGNSIIDNQWENYGISSPYILRYNGMYYLYSSTTVNDTVSGVRAWKSRDLIHWEKVITEGLKPGYVVAHTVGATLNARAPEVYYYAGSFYMFESYNKGSGHFVLKSDSPEGPFVSLTNGAIDSLYDGTLVFDKDENPYFVTAHKNNINISTMESINSIIETELVVKGTDSYSGLYAESPSIFEHIGKYYLLYSSGYSTTDGYQINYAVSDGWENETPGGFAQSFKKGASDRLLLNADKNNGFTGLGHPSVFLGPDLDSYYVTYDCLDDNLSNRFSMNIDRLIMDGDLLSTSHNRYNSIRPKMADFVSEDGSNLVDDGDFLLSDVTSDSTFSVEYNFKNADKSKLVFSYVDRDNYGYVAVNMNSSIALHKVSNGNDELIEEVEFYHYFSNGDLHTIRLSYRDKKFDLHFENSLKISNLDVELSGGKIGYLKSDELEINYTCFSNVARGLSDQIEIKQSNMTIPANAYMKDNQIDGLSSYLFNHESGVYSREEDEYKNVGELKFNQKYDYARYLVNFNKSGRYALEMTMDKDNLDKDIIFEIDDKKDVELHIPNINEVDKDVVTIRLGDFNIEQGIHQFKIQNNSHELSFISFRFVPQSEKGYSLLATLKNEKSVRGMVFGTDSRWNFIDEKMVSYDNHRNIALTEENGLSDLNMSVDIALTGSSSIFAESKQSGIIFRCNNYVSYKDYLDKYSDLAMWNNRFYELQGYYLAFTSRKIELYRFNGDFNHYNILDSLDYDFGSRVNRNVIMKIKGNQFDLFIDNQFVKSYYDAQAFTSGSVGVYTTGAEVTYQNLKIQSTF
ncbi:MAG: family 43 glycosylhydrolase [Bacilli bacterium]|nr:family 43 glycosylhydrolase [Bacilli bacterium]